MAKNKFCDCEFAGYCPRYKKGMHGRLYEICQGVNVDPVQAAAYRAQWLAQVPERDGARLKAVDCEHFGAEIKLADGSPLLRECQGCGGKTRLKVFACTHPHRPFETTVTGCRQCPYGPFGKKGEEWKMAREVLVDLTKATPEEKPQQTDRYVSEKTKNVVIRFDHGLGDSVAFLSVLAHLRKHRPEWSIRLHVKDNQAALFPEHECNSSVQPNEASYDLNWFEGIGSETKARRCLRDVFGIEPEEELMRYRFEPSSDAIAKANEYFSLLSKDRPMVAIHARTDGYANADKEIPVGVLRAFCKWLTRRGLTVLLFDWGSPKLPMQMRHLFFAPESKDPGLIAAMLARTRLNVAIDSGPQKLAMTTGVPLLCVWRKAHPYWYVDCGTEPEQLHLIPENHEDFLNECYGVKRYPDLTLARQWLTTKCPHHIYKDLFSGLCTGASALLGEADKKHVVSPGAPAVIATERRKLLLHCGLPPGDVMTLTAAVETLHRLHPGKYETAVSCNHMEIWEGNPHVVPTDSSFERVDVHYHSVNQSGNRPVHFIEGYAEFLGQYLDIDMRACVNRPFVYLSEEEKRWMNQVWEVTKNPSPYWVLNAGVKTDYTAKYYPYFQEVVDMLRSRVRFAQVGLESDLHPPLSGVVDLRGKTSLRALLRLVYHAQGVLSGVSFLMHAAAAFEKPGVIVAGGREPRLWNSYPTLLLLNNVGALDCCKAGACWRGKVVPVGEPKGEKYCDHPMPTLPYASGECMTRISSVLVAEAVKSFLP